LHARADRESSDNRRIDQGERFLSVLQKASDHIGAVGDRQRSRPLRSAAMPSGPLPFDSRHEAQAWLEAERVNIPRIASLADSGTPEISQELALLLADFTLWGRLPGEVVTISRNSLTAAKIPAT
jgi:hypothetical protein